MFKTIVGLLLVASTQAAQAESRGIDGLVPPSDVAELMAPYVGDAPDAAPRVQCICKDVWQSPMQDYMAELEYSMQPRGLMGPMS